MALFEMGTNNSPDVFPQYRMVDGRKTSKQSAVPTKEKDDRWRDEVKVETQSRLRKPHNTVVSGRQIRAL